LWRRILSILVARNREFYRDHAGLGWNIMPILMVLAFAFIFSDPPEDLLKIGVIRGPNGAAGVRSPFLATRHVTLVPMAAPAEDVAKVERHQLDLLVDLSDAPGYWVNLNSPPGLPGRTPVAGGLCRAAPRTGPAAATP
jgi:hypothetical protein